MRTSLGSFVPALALLAIGVGVAGAAPLGTGFIYQGQLKQAGVPQNGSVDLAFALYAAPTGGAPLGSQSLPGIVVQDGCFSVTLNAAGQFGANAFNGDERWLEISVNGNVLSPRQPVAATPYALRALTASSVPGVTGYSLNASDGDPVNALYVDAEGRVGVGTTTPQTRFNVIGDAYVTSTLGVGRTPAGFAIEGYSASNGLMRLESPDTFGSTSALVNTSSGGAAWALVSTGSAHSAGAGRLVFRNISAALDRMVLDPSGNVGIGTNAPGQRLDVRGSILAQNSVRLDNATLPMIVRDADTFTSGAKSGFGRWGMYLETGTLFLGIPGTDYAPVSRLTFGGWLANSTRQDWMTIQKGGNVGIGNISPATALHVTRNPTGPEGTLAIEGTNHAYVSMYPAGMAAGRKAWFGFGNPGSADVSLANENSGGHINLVTSGGGRTRVNVLEIVGGSDIAEPFNVHTSDSSDATPAAPGMVVSIDASRVGELRVATRAYDRAVAGVISGANGVNTGMILTQKESVADGKHPVAMTGRVWTWCDADAGGPITAGDLLTTSDTPGHAMRAADAAAANGATIGKAMSSLERGRGMVLVLVNLQ